MWFAKTWGIDAMSQQMHLNLFIHSRGHHEASWRHPKASPKALTDISYFVEVAQTAERGLFDSIFLADTLVVNDDVAHAARTWLEPISTLGALAMATKKIGLKHCKTYFRLWLLLTKVFSYFKASAVGRSVKKIGLKHCKRISDFIF